MLPSPLSNGTPFPFFHTPDKSVAPGYIGSSLLCTFDRLRPHGDVGQLVAGAGGRLYSWLDSCRQFKFVQPLTHNILCPATAEIAGGAATVAGA